MDFKAQIESNRHIIDKAIVVFKPKPVCLTFSGGNNPLAAYVVTKQIRIKIDAVIYDNYLVWSDPGDNSKGSFVSPSNI